MIRFQIIDRTGANLQKLRVDAMPKGELRVFDAPSAVGGLKAKEMGAF